VDASNRGSVLLGVLVLVVLGAYVAVGVIFYAGFSKAEAFDRRIERLVEQNQQLAEANRRMILDRAEASCAGEINRIAADIAFVDSLVATAQSGDERDGEDTARAEAFRESEHDRILGSGVPPACDGVKVRAEYVREVDEAVARQAKGGG
jgi:hypothetical protein